MLSDEGIVCFSSIDWDFNWQGHQEIMSALAAWGNHVLFIENTGVRSATLRDLPRLRDRVRNWRRGANGLRPERDRLTVHSPILLPFPYTRAARWVNRAVLGRVVRRWMRTVGCPRPIVWTFLPTPLVRDVIRALRPELTIYYCIDDLPSSSPPAARLGTSETAFLREADLVFVTADRLRARAARFREQVHLAPFGVNYERFESVRTRPHDSPPDIRAVPRPIVGYVGGLNQKLDQELLADVADRLPDVSFVLVGPAETDVSRLRKRPNVWLLGTRPHADVPRYLKEFAVAIVPYRLTEYTSHVYPNKLNEYLAMGTPVVSTRLPEIERFCAVDGEVIAVAGNADEFARAIRRVLQGTRPRDIDRRIEAARRNAWSGRLAELSALIEKELAARRGAPVRSAD